MKVSSTDSSFWPHTNWRYDGLLRPRPNDHFSATRLVYCSPARSPLTATHVAKMLPHEASEELWHAFERQAYLAVALATPAFKSPWQVQIAEWRLNTPCAILVYPRLQGSRLDDWADAQSQWVPRSVWVELGCQLLTQLEALHSLGYVHGRICPEHVWVDARGPIHLLGFGQCAMVGQPLTRVTAARWPNSPFAAPELQRAEGEATSAQDIYSMAAILDLISGGPFTKTPVGKCMQAACPYDRPTAAELLELFRSYQHELNGSFTTPLARAA